SVSVFAVIFAAETATRKKASSKVRRVAKMRKDARLKKNQPAATQSLGPSSRCLLLGGRKPAIDLVPVQRVPPSRDVVSAAILVLEVIRMLPHVDAHDRRLTIHDWAILIRRGGHRNFAILARDKPRPA